MKKATSKKLLNAVKVDGAVITEENGNVSVRKAPWNETEVISDKPQVIRGRMIFSGGENGRGDWVDFKPYMCRASERSPSRRFSRPSTGWCALASEPCR